MQLNNDYELDIYITSKNKDKRISRIDIGKLIDGGKNSENSIIVKKDLHRQEILGFGGAFTEASASIYHKLDKVKKNEIIQAYFGKRGNAYNMARTHINSCDFSLGNYALCDTADDTSLSSFSLERDKKMLIPMIQDALKKTKDELNIMASPWSPPSWMKTNNQMNHGGKLKPEYRASWAKYYCKYIDSYENEGIPIWGISVQNEPEAIQTWDSCTYSGEEERDFIRDYLGPELEKGNLSSKKLIIWDHNRDVMLERARTILNDKRAAKYIWGTGFHWYNGDHFDEVQKVHDEFPDKELIFTEGCQEGGPHIGSWGLGERYATSIINDLNRWTVAWIDWNLILDENGGPNHVGNFCSAPIIVDTQNQDILYQSSYYYMGHFSRFIERGMTVVECENSSDKLLALSTINNKDKTITIIMNKENHKVRFTFENMEKKFQLAIPSRSIVTICDR